jgi:hypothetical protein
MAEARQALKSGLGGLAEGVGAAGWDCYGFPATWHACTNCWPGRVADPPCKSGPAAAGQCGLRQPPVHVLDARFARVPVPGCGVGFSRGRVLRVVQETAPYGKGV